MRRRLATSALLVDDSETAPAKGQLMDDYPLIADHGLIGDLQTAALVTTDGSIDWFCFPRFDSPSVFGALLDHRGGGRYRIRPTVAAFSSKQMYLPDTAILITRFLTKKGFTWLRCGGAAAVGQLFAFSKGNSLTGAGDRLAIGYSNATSPMHWSINRVTVGTLFKPLAAGSCVSSLNSWQQICLTVQTSMQHVGDATTANLITLYTSDGQSVSDSSVDALVGATANNQVYFGCSAGASPTDCIALNVDDFRSGVAR